MKEKPALSIIIPFHGSSVTNTITSLEKCGKIERCEVILVSDGLDKYALDPLGVYHSNLNLKVVVADKCGRIGHLRNLGIQQAESDHFYFVDSDCLLEDDAIERIMGVKAETIALKGRNVFIGKNWISRLDAQLRDERYQSNPAFAYCPNLVIHRSVFDQLGFFNSQATYGSDGEFAKRMSEKMIDVKYDKDIVLYHDCTNSFSGVFGKWTNLGEARYYRYRNEEVKNKLSTYFPNLFSLRRGLCYNGIALLCDVGRAIGMLRAWLTERRL